MKVEPPVFVRLIRRIYWADESCGTILTDRMSAY